MAFDEAWSLLERWRQIEVESGLDHGGGAGLLPEAAQLLQRVEPVRQWVAQEQRRRAAAERFEAACSALGDAVRRSAPNETLLRLNQEAAAFGEPVPQALEDGVRAILAARKRVTRVTRVSIAVAAVVVLLLGGVGVNRLARDHSEEVAADRWRQGIQAKLDDRDPQEAERLSSKLSSDAPKLARRAICLQFRPPWSRPWPRSPPRAKACAGIWMPPSLTPAKPAFCSDWRDRLPCRPPGPRPALSGLPAPPVQPPRPPTRFHP